MNKERKTRLYFPRPHSLLTAPLRVTPRKLARGFLGVLLCCAPLLASAQIRVEAESAFTNVGMQFENTTDSGGGQNAGWIDAGDYLEFTVNIPSTGTYRVDYRVASPNATGSVILGEGGVDLAPALAIPNTGGWQSWTTISNEVTLDAGTHTLVIWAAAGGWNFNWFELHAVTPPPSGTTLPGTIQAENWATMSGVATEATTDAGGGSNVGWIEAGDWIDYNVNVTSAGSYTVNARVASASGGGAFNLLMDGQNVGSIAFGATGGWQTWTTATGSINLPSGNHTLRVAATQAGWNLNWVEFDEGPGITPPPTGSLPMIRQQGKDWAINGQPIRLRGLNLGNWLQLEFWMMNEALSTNAGTIHDQCTLEAALDSRFGYNERERLMDIFRNNWMTDRDWDAIAALGFNVVRLPFPHNLIEDENNPYTLRSDAWEFLDKAIAEAAERGIYTILDLHGAAGSQGWEHHSGCSNRNWYWDGGNGQPASHYQDRTHWLWDMIAQRYNGNGDVAAYGLLNEPWGTDGQTLANNLTSLYHTVRAKDSEHIIIMHGHAASGIDYFGVPGNDVAYEMHFYPGIFGWRDADDPTLVHIDWLFCNATGGGGGTCDWDANINNRQVPFLIGEFQPWTELGANGGEITRKTYDVYNGLGWAATAWSYKTVSTAAHSGDSNNGWPWGLITNTSGFSPINVSTASIGEIENWFGQFSSQSLVTHGDIAYWLNYQPTAGGGTIEAEHFRWHAGVRMEVTTDPIGGDFNASYLDTGDWMVYRVNVPQAGNYQFQYRVASPSGGTVSASLHNSTGFGNTAIPATGGWQNWQTITGPTVYLNAGQQDISLYVAGGGWNINWWQLVPQ